MYPLDILFQIPAASYFPRQFPSLIYLSPSAKAGVLRKQSGGLFLTKDWGLREQTPDQEETQSVSSIMRVSADDTQTKRHPYGCLFQIPAASYFPGRLPTKYHQR